MRGCRRRHPTGTWREFLPRHASRCGPATFSMSRRSCPDASRLLRHPAREQGDPPRCIDAADWAAQQIVECCAWDRAPPRFLIHDRGGRYGANFDRRVRGLGIRQVRTLFRSPRANAVAERWVRSARSECLDYLIVFNEVNLRRVLSAHGHLLQSLATAPIVGPCSSMRRGKAPPSASMPKDRRGTGAWVTSHLPRCCMTSFCAPVCCRDNRKGGRYVVKLCKR
jgi:transposase InsO family protein